jgi:hypothetical protein
MDFDDTEDEDNDVLDLIKDANIDDFVHTDDEKTKTICYDSITVIDALSLANYAWLSGAPFDADVRIIKDIVDSDPVRIVSKEEVVINSYNMYCVWGLVSVQSLDYPVAIRFYADAEELDSKVFQWSIDQPVNNICLPAIVEVFKHRENERWADLLDV